MHPQRFQEFALEAVATAPDVKQVSPWQDSDRPFGFHVVFMSGSELWVAVTTALAPGEKHDSPAPPVLADPPADVPLPELYADGKVSPLRAAAYLAAVIGNSGSREIAEAYAYAPDATAPGFGVTFHNGARAFCPLTHTARPGQGKGTQPYALSEAF